MFKIIHMPTLRVVKDTVYDLDNLEEAVEATIIPDGRYGLTYVTIYFNTIEDAEIYLNQQRSYFIPNENEVSIELFSKYFKLTKRSNKINRKHFTFVEVDDV